VCTCNWDDGGNTTAQQHLDANYAFPIHLGKGDAHGECIHQSGTLKVAVQGTRMVALAPNYRHNLWMAAIAVPSVSIAGKSKCFFTCQSGDDLPRIRHRRDCQCVIFVVLLVIASNGGSCGDVGRKFFVMTSNVGMTPKLIP